MTRVLALAVALAALAACAPPVEEPILGSFFNASRLRDRTALQKIATASFDPAVQGIITSFSITGVVASKAGGRETKDVAISAPVKLPSGEIRQRQLVVTLERDASGGVSGVAGRWIVTAIREPAGAPSAPPR
jgi:hypothetical protein